MEISAFKGTTFLGSGTRVVWWLGDLNRGREPAYPPITYLKGSK